jgi:hypothetical protein
MRPDEQRKRALEDPENPSPDFAEEFLGPMPVRPSHESSDPLLIPDDAMPRRKHAVTRRHK